jgi:hypothetical protein
VATKGYWLATSYLINRVGVGLRLLLLVIYTCASFLEGCAFDHYKAPFFSSIQRRIWIEAAYQGNAAWVLGAHQVN